MASPDHEPRRFFDNREAGCGPVALSIVCAVRNGEKTLRRLIDSYAAQQQPQTELLMIDAVSTDGTWTIIEAARGVVAAALSEPDRGIYDAWNKALPLCSGRYVAFIGCDDHLAPGSLDTMCAAITDTTDPMQPAPQLIAGFNILTRGGMPVALLGEPFRRQRLHTRMMVAHVMAAHRLDWLRAAGGYDAGFRSSGDYELLLRERKGLEVRTLPSILAFMEDGGTSRQRWRPHLENFHARRKAGYGLILSSWLLLRAAGFTVLRMMRLK
ncbi:glycosyltransferase [Piscinibacter sakaiensis]|uniref:glycosyltransferase n=1 Tax=Piscinibacter sakaiensis TaxID=1547922 RepID=UPI003AAC1135